MKKSLLAAIASVLTLIVGLFSSGFAAAQPAAVPDIANGTYRFELNVNHNLCLENNGTGIQMTISAKHCAHVVLRNVRNSNGFLLLSDSANHCIYGNAANKVIVSPDPCSVQHDKDIWRLTHANPDRFESDLYSGWMAVNRPRQNYKVFIEDQYASDFRNWKLVKL